MEDKTNKNRKIKKDNKKAVDLIQYSKYLIFSNNKYVKNFHKK